MIGLDKAVINLVSYHIKSQYMESRNAISWIILYNIVKTSLGHLPVCTGINKSIVGYIISLVKGVNQGIMEENLHLLQLLQPYVYCV